MGILRQIGVAIISFVVFMAVIAALSRLLKMNDLPDMIGGATKGLANLFNGAFGYDPPNLAKRRS